MKRWKPLAVPVISLGVFMVLLFRTHGCLTRIIAAYDEFRPPIWYMAQAVAAVTEALPPMTLAWAIVTAIRIIQDPGEPDYSVVDWRSAGAILREMYYPARDHGDHWEQGGLWQQVSETHDTLEQLQSCGPDHLPEAILREWASYSPEAKYRLRSLMDGVGDDADWRAVYERRYRERLAAFVDAAERLTEWYESNAP